MATKPPHAAPLELGQRPEDPAAVPTRPADEAGLPPARLHLGLLGLGLAHELSGPLTAVGLGLEWVVEGLRAGRLAPTEAAEALSAQVARLQRLGGLLDRFRRLAAGAPGRIESVRLSAVLGEIDPLVRPACLRLGVALDLDAGLEDAEVRGDPLLLAQAVACLVLNAAEASAPAASAKPASAEAASAASTWEAPAPPPKVRVLIWAEGGEAGLSVEDRGPGFGGVVQPGVTAKGGDNLGVGLSLARLFVERSGGELRWGDRPGGGATVTLRFPATR